VLCGKRLNVGLWTYKISVWAGLPNTHKTTAYIVHSSYAGIIVVIERI